MVLESCSTLSFVATWRGNLRHLDQLPFFQSLTTALPPDSRPVLPSCYVTVAWWVGATHKWRGSGRRAIPGALAALPSLLRSPPFCQASLGRGSTTSVSSACIRGQAEEAKGIQGMAPPWRAPRISESLQPPSSKNERRFVPGSFVTGNMLPGPGLSRVS